jgi:hypothetical protein
MCLSLEIIASRSFSGDLHLVINLIKYTCVNVKRLADNITEFKNTTLVFELSGART